ncbi:MAG: signal peptide peptidase SppA [Candidatus Nanohaloarchaeota archaeon QJJ-5]|nr:signal peptide peptidase SppA [Candidatus Nanohaloarchaeota archaeon QJJ-5]
MQLSQFSLTQQMILGLAVVMLILGLFSGGMMIDTPGKTSGSTVGVIPIQGTIQTGGTLQQSQIDPGTIRNLVQQASGDNVAAYLFEINSPGGGVVASRDLARVVESLDKPTVCVFKDVAASGAYWTAVECDHIVADAMSVTGSIGATSAYLEFSDLLEQYGVEYVNLTAGEYKDAGSQFKELEPDEREILQRQLDTVHETFIEQVADGRNMSIEEARQHATGETFLGQEAKDRGLVDELGGRDEAITYIEDELNRSVSTQRYQRSSNLNLLSLLMMRVGQGIGQSLTPSDDGPSITLEQ